MVVSALPAKTKHLIYPLFLPNHGCPGGCIYCDQVKISGAGAFDLDKAVQEVAGFIQRNPKRSKEVAFYGGTFTALPLSFREEILSRILEVVDEGTKLRISTHPLWINEDILRHCAEYRIQTIELGIQDWHDRPLALCGRGYTSAQALEAAHLVKDMGFTLGIQLMPGLPGSDIETLDYNHLVLTSLRPHMLRLYPVVVIRGTELQRSYEQGLYKALDVAEAVTICADYAELCEPLGIRIIKYGLPSNIDPADVIAGAYHPALGELVKRELAFRHGAEQKVNKRHENCTDKAVQAAFASA